MKGKLIAVGLVLTLFAGLGVAVAQSSGWNFGRFQTFMRGLGVGTRLQTGMVTAQAQGSREIFTGYNSSGSKTFAVSGAGAITAVGLTNTGALTGTTCTLSGALTGTTGTFSGALSGASLATGGNATVTGTLTAGTLNCTTASYTNLDASGSLAVGTTSTLTGAVTANNNLTVAGVTTANGALFPKQVTADACTDAGFGPGAIFWNNTSGYMCYCDSNTDDLKMNDNSTACF